MDLGALFLLLAAVVLIFLFVLQPLTRRPRRLPEEEHELSAMLAERDRLLEALQELDFDHSLGKIPAEDYPVQRALLVQHGAEVLRRIDGLAPVASPAGQSGAERLEKTVAAGRITGTQIPAAPGPSDEELEDLIARRRAARKGKVAGFCPRCGKPVLQADAFCPSCGTALKSK